MDIYKAFNSHIDLLKYEIYVKLSQASKSTKVMDKNLLEKLLEYEEAEEQRAYMTLLTVIFISKKSLENKELLEYAKELAPSLITITRHKLYLYSVLNSFNVTDPFEKLYYLKSLDENIFSKQTDKLLEKYPLTMARGNFKVQNTKTLDKNIYQILKTYAEFPEEYIAILSNFLPEVSKLKVNSLIELSNYNQVYIAKTIGNKINSDKVDENNLILAIVATFNHYLSPDTLKQKRL